MKPSVYLRNLWHFTFELGDRRYLVEDISPEAIIEKVTASPIFAEDLDTKAPTFEDGNKGGPFEGAKRLNARLLVEKETYDLFLNHVNGYRGHFAVSQEAGADFNGRILAKLASALEEKFGQDPNRIPCENLGNILCDHQSKIWQYVKVTQQYEWKLEPEIYFERWVTRGQEAIEAIAQLHDWNPDKARLRRDIKKYLKQIGKDENLYQAIFGVRAPLPLENRFQLIVRSAWVKDGATMPATGRESRLFWYGWT